MLKESDMLVMEYLAAVERIAGVSEIEPITLSIKEHQLLMCILHCLTYPVRIGMRKLVPTKVLSEILVFD